MFINRLLSLACAIVFCGTTSVLAADLGAGSLLKRRSVEETITLKLEQARPGLKISSVTPAPISGLYQAKIAGGPTLFVTADGDKFIAGELFNVEANGFARWEDPALIAERKSLMANVNPNDAIVFKPQGKTKAVVYVFTDVDCGYCRKLHSQIADYNNLGIEIRYLAFPRAGIPSPSADKLVSAWCSKDKQKALTLLKQDQPVTPATCDNPVAAEFDLGGRLGVNGTPALWVPSGELKPGYVPPEDLARELGIL